MTIKNLKLVFLMIVVAGILIVPAYAQSDLEVYVGRDDFDSEKWVSSLDNTVVNTTLEVLLLNQTMDGFEDFTTYTEVDVQGILVVNSSHISFDGNMRGTADEFVYKSHESKGNYSYIWDVYIDSVQNNLAFYRETSLMLTNITNDWNYIFNNNEDALVVVTSSRGSSTGFYYYLVDTHGGSNTFNVTTENGLSIDTWYYLRLEKTGLDIVLSIFDDSERTSLVESISITIAGVDDYTYNKIFAASNVGFATTYTIKGWTRNLNIQNGAGMEYVPTGNFYSINLMENSTQPGIVRNVFGVAEIPAGTSLQVLTSDDNSTWTIHNVTEQFDLDMSALNYTDLYVRFRLNSSDILETPLVDFYYVTYDFNCTPGGGNITILAGNWTTFNVSSITVPVGTYVHGNLTSLENVDGFTYLVDEVSGVPGFDIRYNFTGIPENSTSLSLRAFCEYEGNPAHDVDYEGWNFDTLTWDDLINIPEHGFAWHNESLSLGYYNQNGSVWIRVIHHTGGVPSHYFNVDYIRLRAFVPTGGTINVDAWGINWLLSIIWLVLVAIGIFDKNKILIMFAGFFGIILAILMFTENMMVAVALICVNLYLLYEGTE